MGDLYWPRTIKPLTNKNYSYKRGGNVRQFQAAGGLARSGLDNTLESPVFKLNFSLRDIEYQVALNFYDVAINHGANSFKMMLNSGTGIVEHQCKIVANTWSAVRPSHNNWFLAFDVYAEVTPSQLEECSNLSELWDCYGMGLFGIVDGLESFVKGVPDV